MISMDEARTRVDRGAAHLDAAMPGWERRIDVGTLTLSSCLDCVMGQLGMHEYGEHRSGMFSKMTDAVGWLTAHDCREHGVGAVNEADFPLLQECWIEAIAARLHPDSVAPLAPAEAVSA